MSQTKNAVVANAEAPRFAFSTNGPIRFENLHPGSFFSIFAEPSRRIRRSDDSRVYRRARDHEGFYATAVGTGTAAILMPQDLVRPMKKVK